MRAPSTLAVSSSGPFTTSPALLPALLIVTINAIRMLTSSWPTLTLGGINLIL
jgi:hypothetical protein